MSFQFSEISVYIREKYNLNIKLQQLHKTGKGGVKIGLFHTTRNWFIFLKIGKTYWDNERSSFMGRMGENSKIYMLKEGGRINLTIYEIQKNKSG